MSVECDLWLFVGFFPFGEEVFATLFDDLAGVDRSLRESRNSRWTCFHLLRDLAAFSDPALNQRKKNVEGLRLLIRDADFAAGFRNKMPFKSLHLFLRMRDGLLNLDRNPA